MNTKAENMLSIYDPSVPYTYEPYTYPDNVGTANNAFQDGYYKQTMEYTLDTTADLRIGMRHFAPTVFDWACVDNFSLFYIKNNETGIKDIEQSALNNQHSVYDLSGRRVGNSQLSTLNSQLKKGVYIVNGKKIAL